jgi:ATP-binding cassette subfamily B protein RaxB
VLDALSFGGPRRRLPMILQTEGAECGLACLAMVAARHGFDSDLATLRRRFSVSMKGATMADLVRVAGLLHLNPRALRAEMEHLPQLELPCILHWDLNHFVVLKEISSGRAVIHDPARGVRRLSLAEVSRHFTGIALELTPEADFRPGVEKQTVGLRQLLGRVAGLKRSLVQIFLLALALEAFVLLTPFYLQWVVDGVLVSNDRDLLVTLGIGFGLLVLIQVGAGAIRSWAVLHLSATLNLQWLGNVFAHLMRLPVSWFDRRHTGDVMSRFGAVQQIQKTMTTSFVEAVLDGLMVVVTLAMMLVYSGTLTTIAAGRRRRLRLLRRAFFRPLREATEEAIVFDAKRSSPFPRVSARRAVDQAVQSPGRPAGALHEPGGRCDERRHRRPVRLDLMFVVLHKLVFGLERVAVIWVGALLVLEHRFSVGMLFAFLAYKEQFAQRVSALIDKAVEIKMLRLQGERLADIVLAEPEPVVDMPARLGPGDADAQMVADLRFAYSRRRAGAAPPEPAHRAGRLGGDRRAVGLRQDDLAEVHARHPGAAGRADPDRRRRPATSRALRTWRAMIGTVMQEDQLFAGSIIDNITFFDADADTKWAEQCARVAAIADEIEAMPMGWHTLVGDMGTSCPAAAAADPAGAGALQAAEVPVPRRGDERPRRRDASAR